MWLVSLCHALPTSASADSITPRTCGPGTRAVQRHSSGFCVPHRCAGDGDCPGQMWSPSTHVCRPTAICRQVSERTVGSRFERATELTETSSGLCTPSGACELGQCYAGSVCVPRDSPQAMSQEALRHLEPLPASLGVQTRASPSASPPGTCASAPTYRSNGAPWVSPLALLLLCTLLGRGVPAAGASPLTQKDS